jgi:hypothetical protein
MGAFHSIKGAAAGFAGLSGLLVLLGGCGGSMNMKKSEQGLSGTFTTYGPPAVLANCEPLVTQAEKDSCKRENQRVIEKPYQSELIIRNLGTRESVKSTLDAQGSFKVGLLPGSYEICVNGECSDPIDVRMGEFTTYGQRLPRPAATGAGASSPSGASAAPSPSGTVRTAR